MDKADAQRPGCRRVSKTPAKCSRASESHDRQSLDVATRLESLRTFAVGVAMRAARPRRTTRAGNALPRSPACGVRWERKRGRLLRRRNQHDGGLQPAFQFQLKSVPDLF